MIKNEPGLTIDKLYYAFELASGLKLKVENHESISVNANEGPQPFSMDEDFTWIERAKSAGQACADTGHHWVRHSSGKSVLKVDIPAGASVSNVCAKITMED